MKNPNGYGGVSKLPGNRRRPYRVRLTTGWQQEGGKRWQKYHTLGYYASRRAALIALADYNKRPYDLNLHHITCAELYKKWYAKHTARLSQSSCYSFAAAWKKCAALWQQPITSVKKTHMQAILDDNQHLSASVQTRLKTIFSGIFRLALENDLISVDYSHYLEKSSTATQMARSIFSRSEISCLWQNLTLALPLPNGSRHHYIDVRLVDTILIMLYSGIRIGELLQIKTAQIDLKKQIIDLHGTKTKAAKRILPLHKEILPLIEARMHGTYLIEAPTGQNLNYDAYKKCFFDPLMAQLKMQHKPHDCRHTFISGMDSCGVAAGSVILKRIVGHANADVTESYTHKNIRQLVSAVNKLKY
ncbi:tyrosine-type recombinase/integrase [Phascolarctobacterium sp.]|uniref:tyrosine-type recombinase/integrase n=1 Tax=Phascolarctobacterium sp. TaxID=2049039 RepID=UPI0030783E42